MFKWLKMLKEDDIRKDKRYKEAKERIVSKKLIDKKSYRLNYEFIKDRIYDYENNIENINKSADNLIRYIAPSSGVLGIIILYIISQTDNLGIFISILIGMFLMIVSMICSSFSLSPLIRDYKFTMDILIDEYINEEEQLFNYVKSLAMTLSILTFIIEYKKKWLVQSYRFFIGALAWLIFGTPLIYIIFA